MPKLNLRFLLESAGRLVLIGTILTAVYYLGDAFVSQNILTNKDTLASKLTASLAYLSLGSVVGVIVGTIFLLFVPSLARKLDPSYQKLSFEGRKLQRITFISGSLAAAATGCILFAYQSFDAATVGALAACSVMFVVIHDTLKKQINPAKLVIPMIFVMIGAIVTSGVQVRALAIESFVLIFLIRNIVYAADEHFKQLGVEQASSALVFTYWRFMWLMIWGVSCSVVLVVLQHQFDLYMLIITRNLVAAVLTIVVVMIVVTFGDNLVNLSRKDLKASEVNLVFGLLSGIVFVFTFLVSQIAPGLLGPFPTDTGTILIRLGGVCLIVVGVIVLSSLKKPQETKAQQSEDLAAAK
jgi:hypothetical protein